MEKGNKIRLIFWIFILIITVSLTLYGRKLHYDGYGKYGQIRQELTKIATTFENLNAVKSSNTILSTKISKNQLIIKYKKDKKRKTYNCTYEETANLKLLRMEYKIDDLEDGEFISKNLLEAVSIINSNSEGDLFKLYTLNNFYKTNSIQGANLSQKNGNIYLTINIEANLIQNLKDSNLNQHDVIYISTNELTNLLIEINDKNHFNYRKKNIILDIYRVNRNYEIYVSNTEDNMRNIYESAMSAVSILNTRAYDQIILSNYEYDKDISSGEYKIEINPKIDNENIMADGKYLMKITLYN